MVHGKVGQELYIIGHSTKYRAVSTADLAMGEMEKPLSLKTDLSASINFSVLPKIMSHVLTL